MRTCSPQSPILDARVAATLDVQVGRDRDGGVLPDPVRVIKRLAPFGLEVLGANARASGETLRLVIGTLGRV